MKLAFYYHLEVAIHNNTVCIPSLLGVFIDNLAQQIEKFYLFAHTTNYDANIHDYIMYMDKVELVDLGPKSNFPNRLFRGNPKLKEISDTIELDVLLVRAPTPLAPWLFHFFKKKPISFLFVGDYSLIPSSLSSRLFTSIYEIIMNHWVIPNCKVLVNSRALFNKYSGIAKNVEEVRTTTITNSDFFYRSDTCQNDNKHLLYVGRYDWANGFEELFCAVAQLQKERHDVILHLVGWDDTPNKHIQKEMEHRVSELGISDIVIWEGKKSIGIELNSMYRNSDIFVLPSYSEGMPRCIWEAMANGLPVVASAVGGVPYNIADRKDALLISPHDTEALVRALLELLSNQEMRQDLIKNGYIKAKDATLEVSNSKIIQCLKIFFDVE